MIQGPSIVKPLVRRDDDALQSLAPIRSLTQGAGEVRPVEAEYGVRLVEELQCAGIEILRGGAHKAGVRAGKAYSALLVADDRRTECFNESDPVRPRCI